MWCCTWWSFSGKKLQLWTSWKALFLDKRGDKRLSVCVKKFLVKAATSKRTRAQWGEILFEGAFLFSYFRAFHKKYYTKYLIIKNGHIRNGAEFWGKFKKRALGSSNLRNAFKNIRNAQCSDFQSWETSNIFHLYVISNFSLFLFLSVQHSVLNKISLLLWSF